MQGIKTLQEFEAAGKYLFHGTTVDDIKLFEPRQAVSYGKNDGPPCVAASEYIDPAIFMAIFGGRVTCGWNSNGTSFGFYLKRPDYNRGKARGWSGFVYVFDRAELHPYAAWEWRTYTPIKPLKKLSVTFEELPSGIELT